ncbi:MAG: hypothetical protein MUF42_09005 [Cytophagaceae bacterium]|nr:hypothetical protein [Cytophagaceae bacterium]
MPVIWILVGMAGIFLMDLFSKSFSTPLAFFILLLFTFFAAVTCVLPWAQHSSFLFESSAWIPLVRLLVWTSLLGCWLHMMFSEHHVEPFLFYCLIGCAVGADLLLISTHWILLITGLETLSICSYLLVAGALRKENTEASVKYLLVGVSASAVMLFGVSLLYGMQGHMQLGCQSNLPILPGMLLWTLVLSGLLFKIAAPPFHFWIPDSYQVSPSPVVFYLSTAPKMTGLLVIWKIFQAQESYPSYPILRMVLSGLAILAILWGSLSALRQNNMKRMLAYSSVAHSGLFLAGLIAVPYLDPYQLLFYFWIYLFALIAALMLIDYMEKNLGNCDVRSMAGKWNQMPLASALLVFLMIALTGLPPTAIFYGKVFVFAGLASAFIKYQEMEFLILLLTGAAGTLFSLFFYLKGPYYLYFKHREYDQEKFPYHKTLGWSAAFALPVLVFFLNPDWLMNLLR